MNNYINGKVSTRPFIEIVVNRFILKDNALPLLNLYTGVSFYCEKMKNLSARQNEVSLDVKRIILSIRNGSAEHSPPCHVEVRKKSD